MANAGMDTEVFDQFISQLDRYVHERLIPAEADVIANSQVPDDIAAEMREMGLFGLTAPEEYGGAGMNIPQYVESIRTLAQAHPAYRSFVSINLGMVCSALNSIRSSTPSMTWTSPCRKVSQRKLLGNAPLCLPPVVETRNKTL